MGGWLRYRPGGADLTAEMVTQECTQIGENGLSEPFWGICVHCCVAGSRERRRREVGVFTEASTHTNPEESESNQCFFVGEER